MRYSQVTLKPPPLLRQHPPTRRTSCRQEVDGGRYTPLHLAPRELGTAHPTRPAGIGSAQVLLPIFLACGALKCTVPDVNLAAVSFSNS